MEAIDDEPFDSRMSETTRIAYGHFSSVGSTADKRPLCQRSVTDLATACAAQERHFADRERREVVVQHEALLGFAFETFHALHVFFGAQRGCNQRLRLAAGEDRRTVGARQHIDFDPDSRILSKARPSGRRFCFVTCWRKMSSRSSS